LRQDAPLIRAVAVLLQSQKTNRNDHKDHGRRNHDDHDVAPSGTCNRGDGSLET
jgi:hypothetical protein